MPKQGASIDWAHAAAAQLAQQMGYALIDVELVKEASGRFLRFYLDKPEGITVDDCEAYHRRIQPMMEKIDYDYMEVSSPGADRPLKKIEDFERCQGLPVEVRLYKPFEGAKAYFGDLAGLIDGRVVIEDAEGRRLQFEKKQVALVKPVIDFDEEDLKDECIVQDDADEGADQDGQQRD